MILLQSHMKSKRKKGTSDWHTSGFDLKAHYTHQQNIKLAIMV